MFWFNSQLAAFVVSGLWKSRTLQQRMRYQACPTFNTRNDVVYKAHTQETHNQVTKKNPTK